MVRYQPAPTRRIEENGVHRLFNPGSNGDSAPAARPNPPSASLPQRIGCVMRMMVSVLAIGLGTTGSKVVHRLVNRITAERRGRGLPKTFDYLLLDAADPQPGMDTAHFHHLPGGHGGSGTDPRQGHKLFFTTENCRRLRHTLNTKVLGVMEGDSEFFTKNPREAMAFLVVSGPGATGGGTLHAQIGLIHEVAQERHIADPLVHVVQIGAEMPLRDKDRHVTLEQQRIVRGTVAVNVHKIILDMATDGYIQEPRPDGTTFPISAGRRVWSSAIVDQSNGYCDFATVDDLATMVADALFFRFFTQAGAYLAERICDLNQTGIMNRGKP